MEEARCQEGRTLNPLCSCAVRGYLRPACVPPSHVHQWAITRLVEEFGTDQVRVAWLTDYGRHQVIAVSLDDWKTGVVWTLTGRHPDDEGADIPREKCRWYDLNDNRDDLDRFISKGKQLVAEPKSRH
jgi:hypothetical protein